MSSSCHLGMKFELLLIKKKKKDEINLKQLNSTGSNSTQGYTINLTLGIPEVEAITGAVTSGMTSSRPCMHCKVC